jgi:hypothetical protein
VSGPPPRGDRVRTEDPDEARRVVIICLAGSGPRSEGAVSVVAPLIEGRGGRAGGWAEV